MKIIFTVTALCAVVFSNASTLFSDDFESGNLSAWQTLGSAQIVADPLNASNKVVNFTALGSGGNLFSDFFAIPAIGTTTISFDYLGTTTELGSNPLDTGGFLGIDGLLGENWYFGTGNYPGAFEMTGDDQWHHYSVVVANGQNLRVKLEDFAGSDPVAGNAYFDNVTVQSVPEPTTMAALCLGALAMLRRRKRA